jgi:arylsulfatase A
MNFPRPTRIATFCGALLAATVACADAPIRPNIVIILADDLGYGDLSCYGSAVQQTPHLDKLAAEGLRFTDFYMTSPICTPSRVALVTGRYPLRAGLASLLWPTDTAGLPASEITLAEALKPLGYATACIGKWHLGHSQPKQLPMSRGFDYWFGMPYPNDMDGRHPIAKQRKESWPPLPLYRGENLVEQPVDVDLLTQKYNAEALKFIRDHNTQPFLLYLAHAMPHTYLGASPPFRGKSKNGLYGDAVQELDWSVGQVVATLREVGLEQNTLVFFTSDNGAALRKPDAKADEEALFHPDGTYGSNAPLRGGKQSTFEGGVRVPGIAWWPGVIRPGQVVRDPAIVLDLFPTVLELAGAPSQDRVLDGRTLAPVLRGTGRREPTDFYFGSTMLTACRSGRWKLQTVRQPDQAWNARPAGVLLFDLETDLAETHDLASEQPELVRKLRERLAEFEESLQHKSK